METVIHSDDAFAPVEYLNLKKAHLKDKNIVSLYRIIVTLVEGEGGGLVVNASDYGSRGRGLSPLGSNRVVSLSKAHLLPKSTGNTRKRWLRPNMTEKLFTGTLRINQPTNPC